jgi:hypothetical protein
MNNLWRWFLPSALCYDLEVVSPTVFRKKGYRFFFFHVKNLACTCMFIAVTEKLSFG